MKTHAGQLTVSPETVRVLVQRQFPAGRGLPVRSVASRGTVNAVFRVGDRFAARFPLQPAEAEPTRRRLESEAEAAGELAGRTRFPTPEPVALRELGAGHPLPWAVQTWLSGVAAADEGPGESSAFARDLADLIGDLEGERGKAWAFVQAMGLVWYYVESNPGLSRTGRRTLERVLADESPA